MLDGAFGISGMAAPTPGDPSVCVYCAALLVFGDDGALRYPTDGELTIFLRDERLRLAVKTVLAMHRQHGDWLGPER